MKKLILILAVTISIVNARSIEYICYDGIVGINNEYARNSHANNGLEEYMKNLEKTIYKMDKYLKTKPCKEYDHEKAKNRHLTNYSITYRSIYDVYKRFANNLKNSAEDYKKEYGKDYFYIYLIHLNDIEKEK